jgi:hypothetical protein
LFRALVVVRKNLSNTSGGVNVVNLFPNQSVRELAKNLPETMGEISCIEGFSKAKTRKYGQEFLDCISEYVMEHELEGLMSLPYPFAVDESVFNTAESPAVGGGSGNTPSGGGGGGRGGGGSSGGGGGGGSSRGGGGNQQQGHRGNNQGYSSSSVSSVSSSSSLAPSSNYTPGKGGNGSGGAGGGMKTKAVADPVDAKMENLWADDSDDSRSPARSSTPLVLPPTVTGGTGGGGVGSGVGGVKRNAEWINKNGADPQAWKSSKKAGGAGGAGGGGRRFSLKEILNNSNKISDQ